ncbi:MAG: hypothetical protein WA005_16170, partial [Candidatus Binataceae bacterium]
MERGLRSCALTVPVHLAAALIVFLVMVANAARAGDDRAAAAELSDRAFGLLNSLNATSGSANPNPALGAVAGFAADAQGLSGALNT